MQAVCNLRERSLGNVEKVRPLRDGPPGDAFDNVRCYRIRRPSKLTSQFEALSGRKLLSRELMQADEEIVGSLPGDQILMSKHVAAGGKTAAGSLGRIRSRTAVPASPARLASPACPTRLPRQLPILNPVRLVGIVAKPALLVGFVVLIVPLEPDNLAVALEREHVRGDAVEEPAVV